VHPIEWLRAVARSGDVPQGELASEAASALAALGDDPAGLVLSARRLIDRHPTVGVLWWTCSRLLASPDVCAEVRALRNDLDADQVGLSLALDLPDDATVTVIGWSAMADELSGRRGDLRILAVVDDAGARRGPGRRLPSRGRNRFDFDDADDLLEPEPVNVVPASGLGAAVASSDIVLVDVWAAGASRYVAAPGTLAATATARQTDTAVWTTLGVGRRLHDILFTALLRRACPDDMDPWLAEVDTVDFTPTDKVIEPLVIAAPVAPELTKLP
jgi:hypothetical protein